MKNWILFLILIMVCGKNYAQVPRLVVGYEYIGRNTFHTGITGEIRLDEDKKYTFFVREAHEGSLSSLRH